MWALKDEKLLNCDKVVVFLENPDWYECTFFLLFAFCSSFLFCFACSLFACGFQFQPYNHFATQSGTYWQRRLPSCSDKGLVPGIDRGLIEFRWTEGSKNIEVHQSDTKARLLRLWQHLHRSWRQFPATIFVHLNHAWEAVNIQAICVLGWPPSKRSCGSEGLPQHLGIQKCKTFHWILFLKRFEQC